MSDAGRPATLGDMQATARIRLLGQFDLRVEGAAMAPLESARGDVAEAIAHAE